jgi:hypothetical protein
MYVKTIRCSFFFYCLGEKVSNCGTFFLYRDSFASFPMVLKSITNSWFFATATYINILIVFGKICTLF